MLIKFLTQYFKRKTPPPEFRLVPNPRGNYYLERWHSDIKTYLSEATVADQAEAENLIANLGRKTLYWVEAKS